MFWISNVTGSGGMAAILVNQATHVLPILRQPIPRSVFLAVVYGILYTLNARGVRLGARAIIAFAAAKMIPLLLLSIAGLMFVHPENLKIVTAPDAQSLGKALVVAVFAYSGIETALAPSGELRDPARVVPGAAIVGVGIVVVLYVSLQIASQGILGPALSGNDAPLSAVAESLLPGSAGLVIITASVSLIGVLVGDLLGSSRVLYALAEDGFLPSLLARVSAKHRVPTWAILTHAAAAWVLAVSGTFDTLAVVSGAAFCFVYIACCGAAWRLQKTGASETSAPSAASRWRPDPRNRNHLFDSRAGGRRINSARRELGHAPAHFLGMGFDTHLRFRAPRPIRYQWQIVYRIATKSPKCTHKLPPLNRGHWSRHRAG